MTEKIPPLRLLKVSSLICLRFLQLVETLYPGVEPIECDGQRTINLDEVDFDALHNDAGALGFAREKASQMTSKDQRVAMVDDDIEEQIQAELRCMGAASSGLAAESKQGSRRRTKARWFDVVETGTDCRMSIRWP